MSQKSKDKPELDGVSKVEEEQKEAVSFRRWFSMLWDMKLDAKLALIAIVISGTAGYNAHSSDTKAHEHNVKLAAPILQYSVFEEADGTSGIKVENIGSGRASLRQTSGYFTIKEGVWLKYLSPATAKQLGQFVGGDDVKISWSDTLPGTFMEVGKRKNVFESIGHKPAYWSRGDNMYFSICYCDMYDNCFYSNQQTTHKEMVTICSAEEFNMYDKKYMSPDMHPNNLYR